MARRATMYLAAGKPTEQGRFTVANIEAPTPTIKLSEAGAAARNPGFWYLRIGGGKFGVASIAWKRKPTEAELLVALRDEMVPMVTNEIVVRKSSMASAEASLVEAKANAVNADKLAKALYNGEQTARRTGHEARD